jgi:hypothetical protein
MRRRGVLNVSLDRAWVQNLELPNGFVRSFYQTRDERLERVYQASVVPVSRFVYWCHEDHKGERCNTILAEVYATSEGDLWEASINRADPYSLEWRKLSPQPETPKIPDELHAHCQWLEDGDECLIARCPRHGLMPLRRSELVDALSAGKRHAHRRAGGVIFT